MRETISLILIAFLTLHGLPWVAYAQSADTRPPLTELVEQPYLLLFEKAAEWNFRKEEIESVRRQVDQEHRREEDRLKGQRRALENQIDDAQSELRNLSRDPSDGQEVEKKRQELHCRIQHLREKLEETKLILQQGLDNRYQNKLAKLKVLEEWPAQHRKVLQMMETGEAARREFGDFRDVGFRGGKFEGQENDLERGREIVRELKRQGLMPPEVDDPEVVDYINRVAGRVARHSDLRVPLNVTVLKSKEINAFALPGGFLFLNAELILKAENESELVGVIAHEIAHVAARHSNRLMRRATIASIIFQAAQVAALIFTGGVASIATYYALQYGFFGLGLVLDLSLLGVSRDFEIEADILATQYLWHAGYNTAGFISFFDTMAQETGYVTGLSWFRTHPPFYERMSRTFEEKTFLPEQEDTIVDSDEFQQVKERLRRVSEEMEKRDRDAPTLRRVYDCEGIGEPDETGQN